MAKLSGLGGNLWVDEFNLSNDIGAVTVAGSVAPLDVTGIDSSGMERIGGLRDGTISMSNIFFNDAAGASHTALKTLPTVDTIVSYLQGTTVGAGAASLIAKQVDFPSQRSEDGAFLFDMEAVANDLGVVWGHAGTPGQVTDTTTGNEAGVDNGGASSKGLRAFLHVTAFSGTDATVRLEESQNDGGGDAYAAITGGAFTSITGGGAEAIITSTSLAVEQWIRVSISTDNFSSMEWGVVVARL